MGEAPPEDAGLPRVREHRRRVCPRGRLPSAGKEEEPGERATAAHAPVTIATRRPGRNDRGDLQRFYPCRVDEATLAELRAIGASTADAPGVAERDTVAARLAVFLEDPTDPDRRETLLRWAERTARRGPTAETRSAARLVLALLRDGTPPAALRAVDPPLGLAVDPRRAAVAAAAVALAAGGAVLAARALSAPAVALTGPPGGTTVGPALDGRLVFTARGSPSLLRRERWRLDGRDVTRLVRIRGRAATFRPGRLEEGAHAVEVTAGGGLLGASGQAQRSFVVDLTPPSLDVPGPPRVAAWHPLRVVGRTDPDATVTVAGRRARVVDGRFSVALPAPQPRTITVVATDSAGNSTVEEQPLAVVPRRPPAPIRGVHVSADAWRDPALRRGILALIAAHRVNAVELDLKDESGIVGWNPDVPLARRIGAARPIYDLPAAVRRLHRLGVWVIGRLVCFRDPILAAAAARSSRRRRATRTQATAASPTSRARRSAPTTSRSPSRPRTPASTTSSTTTSAARTGRSPRCASPACAARPPPPWSRSCASRGSPSAPTARSSARRCSGSRRHAPARWPRTCPRWRASSTTSRRSSTPRTGRPGSTSSTTRTRTPTRSSSAR